jgi:ribosome-associated toxin RatA of RatAB toxin-antitoxin module
MPGAQKEIIINATPETVFSVITDYGNYPTFLKEVSSCVVDSRNGNSVVSTFKVDIKVKEIGYTIRLTEVPNTKLSWTLIRGDFMEINNGSWTLTDLGDGRTKALYAVEIVPKVPRTLSFMKKQISIALAEKSLPATLQSFKARAERMQK